MAAGLFILSLVVLQLFFVQRSFGFRCATLLAVLSAAILITLSTELLSAFHVLSVTGYVIIDCLVVIAVGALLIKSPMRALQWPRNLDFSEMIMLVIVGAMVLVTALPIVIGAPNTWDAMTYHLPRVEHWAANHSLANYPTTITRQLTYAPFASIVLLKGKILGLSLLGASVVQWVAFVLCVITSSLIVKSLGGNRKAQLLSAVLVVTLPMALLQATSTQNHLVAASWVLIVMYLGIQFIQTGRWFFAMTSAAGCGLAVLTKEVNIILLWPVVMAGLVVVLRQSWQRAALWLVIITTVVLLLNAGFIFRASALNKVNLNQVGVTNDVYSPAVLGANIIRNMAINFDLPFVAPVMTRIAYQIGQIVHVDLNQAVATFSTNVFQVNQIPFDEDYAGAFGHLIVLCMCIWFLRRQIKKSPGLLMLIALSAFVLFCLLVKFQPWHGRFHLIMWMMVIPSMAIALAQQKRPKMIWIIIALLVMGAIVTVLFNRQHPLVGGTSMWKYDRIMQMHFKKGVKAYGANQIIVEAIKQSQCDNIGLVLGEDDWEFPLTYQLRQAKSNRRIEHVIEGNEGVTTSYPLGNFDPCIIIDFKNTTNALRWQGQVYVPVFHTPDELEPRTLLIKNRQQ